MNKRAIRWWFYIMGFILILAGVAALSLSLGPAGIPVRKIFSLLSESKGSVEYSIIFDIRLPRIILGFAIGGALSLAGVILQGMFRNPLVEPYTLGISGGAALGVCLNMLLRLHATFGIVSLPLSGFAGATLTIILVYYLSLKGGILKIHDLLLTGVMLSFIASSLIMLIMSLSRSEDLHNIVFWIMGSLEEPNLFLIKLTCGIAVLGLAISYFFCLDLNAFSLGEDAARHLGVNTERAKRLLFLLASLLTGVCVSVAGLIGFVGLVVPHFVRMLVGRDHRILLISSFICGACFLVFCDTLARVIIAPMELPVGVITGIFGGSIFIYALTRKHFALGEK